MERKEIPPNQTIYVNNLEDKINVDKLKSLLYEFFCSYGIILDIVIKKSKTSRGQAFIVFNSVASSTLAMKGLQGKLFLNKKININYAKTKSSIVDKLEGTYKPPKCYEPSLNAGYENSRSRLYTLFVQNLPKEITKQVLELLFEQYPGYFETRHIPGRDVAFIDFNSFQHGQLAMKDLQNFKVTPENNIKISWAA